MAEQDELTAELPEELLRWVFQDGDTEEVAAAGERVRNDPDLCERSAVYADMLSLMRPALVPLPRPRRQSWRWAAACAAAAAAVVAVVLLRLPLAEQAPTMRPELATGTAAAGTAGTESVRVSPEPDAMSMRDLRRRLAAVDRRLAAFRGDGEAGNQRLARVRTRLNRMGRLDL